MIPILQDRLVVKLKEYSDKSINQTVTDCGGIKITNKIPQLRIIGVEIDPTQASSIFLLYNSHNNVEDVSFVTLIKPFVELTPVPSDSRQYYQWHMKRINVYEAWKHTTGSPTQRVGVCDSGFLLGELDTNDIDVIGWNAIYAGFPEPGVYDTSNIWHEDFAYHHGTNIARIMVAKPNNDGGLVGIAHSSPLVSVTVFDTMPIEVDGVTELYIGTNLDFATGLLKAFELGAKVINASWGSPAWTPFEPCVEAAEHIWDNGGIVVFAAGNAPGEVPLPGGMENKIVSVGGIKRADEPYLFTTYHSNIDITAPSQTIYLWENDQYTAEYPEEVDHQYEYQSGTSYGAPMVAAVCHLVWSVNPNLTNEEVKSIVVNNVDKAWSPLYYETFRSYQGILNAGKSVLAALTTLPENTNNIYPYVQFFGPPLEDFPEIFSGTVVRTTLENGFMQQTLIGAVTVELRGFSHKDNPVTNVKFYKDTTLLYDGPPGYFHWDTRGVTFNTLTIEAETATSSATREIGWVVKGVDP